MTETSYQKYRESHLRANRAYYARKRLDPAFMEKRRLQRREYYKKQASTSEGVKRRRSYANKVYHERIKPDPFKMLIRRQSLSYRVQRRRTKLQETRKQLQALLGGKCVDCGLTDFRLLDFDHKNPIEKTMNISQKLHLPFDTLKIEVDKCELRCPNCHRLKTIAQGGFCPSIREFRNPSRDSSFS